MILSAAQPALFGEFSVRIEVRPIEARPYQLRAVDAARELVRAGEHPLVLVLVTGGGKTTIAAKLILGAHAKGRKALFVAHRREIISQAFWRLAESGVPLTDLGVIQADGVIPLQSGQGRYHAQRPQAPVQVASIQTLARRRLPPADLVFIDEAHHSNASSYAALIHHYTAQGATIIGLTATPVRGDGKGLGDLFRHLHVCAAPAELIEGGWLCAPRVYVGRERADLSRVKVERGDYVVDELAAAVDTNVLVGQIVSEWERLAQGRTTAVFATNVRHSLHIVEQFKAAGVRAEHLDGETPQDARDAILGRLARGETQLVSNCQVLTEGWDLPRCKCVVLARPTKNEGLYLQMAGRGLRPWEGIEALLLDHARCSERFGLPQDERSWTLEGRTKRKKGTSGSDEKEVLAKACPNCDLVVRAGTNVCPECGVLFPPPELPEEVEGELVELTSSRAALLATERERKKVIRRLAEILEPVIAGGVRDDVAWPEANKAVWAVFRKSRTKMNAVELGQVLAALADGGPAHTAILRRLGASAPKASASDLAHLARSQSATVRRLVEKAREHEVEKRYAPPAKAQEPAAPAAPPAAPPQAAPTTVEAFERWSL